MGSPKPEIRRIDQSGRIAIPPEVFQLLRVGRGDYLAFVTKGEKVELRRVAVEDQ